MITLIKKDISYDWEAMLEKMELAEQAHSLTYPRCKCEITGKYDHLNLATCSKAEYAGYMRHKNSKAHREVELAQAAWLEKRPILQHVGPDNGKFWVDICVGQAPTVLLFRQQFNKKFPSAPIRALMDSLQRRNKHLGETIIINLYNDGDLSGLIRMEVDIKLWQETDVEALEEAAEQVRTGRWLLKTTTQFA